MPPAVFLDPCNGHFAHALVAGKCPISVVIANRVVAHGARPATTGTPMPMDICQAVETKDLRYLNQVDHTADLNFDLPNATVEALMDAAQSGVIDGGTALGELGRRVPRSAGDADLRGLLVASISALKAMLEAGIVYKNRQETNGNLVRIWALAVKRTLKIKGPMTHVAGSINPEDVVTAGLDTGTYSGPKLQIVRVQAESEFDMAVYMWSNLAHSLGVMSFEISSHMVFEVAYNIRAKHHETFWTAQEYLIECFDLVDREVCKAGVVANFDRNLVIERSRRLGEAFAEAAHKKMGDIVPMEGGSSKVWNTKYQPGTSKANLCQAYNRNKAHDDPRNLMSDGTCRFRHLCNKWVTDKGPSGKCHSKEHGWYNCTNPAKCDSPLV